MELLLAIGIAALILGVISSVFITVLQSWEEAETEMSLLMAGETLMQEMISGEGLRGSEVGLEDGLTVLSAEPSRAVVLPLWRQVVVLDHGHRITLQPPMQEGAAPPVAFKLPERQAARVLIKDGGQTAQFENTLPLGTRLELYYRPAQALETGHLGVFLDARQGRVMRSYAGQVRRLPTATHGTKVTSLNFDYYLADEADAPRDQVRDQMGLVKAIGVTLTLEKGKRQHTFRRIVGLRNAGRTILVTQAKHRVAILPAPSRIRVFEMRYLAGAEKNARIELQAGPWRCKIRFLTRDTAQVTEELDGVGSRQITVHSAFGVPFLNPDILLDVDGVATRGVGDPKTQREVKPGLPITPLKDASRLHYLDHNRNGSYNLGETVFLDDNLSGRLEAADRVLVQFRQDKPDTPARAFTGKNEAVAYYESRNPGRFDEGEDLILDWDGDGVFGGPFYNCSDSDEPYALDITEFGITGATLIIR